MKTVKETFETYWEKVGKVFGIEDSIEMVYGEDEWEDDEVIEFRNSCGDLLSRHNRDKGISEYN